MGDFNAKIGPPLANEHSIGRFVLGVRNSRGQTLVNFLEQKHLYAMNTFFQKRPSRKWTWASPDGHTKNELDFIISSHKYIVTDVTVLSRFRTGSDHKLVRATYRFNLKRERTKIITAHKRYEMQDIAFLEQNYQFREELKNQFEGLDELNLDVDHINQLLCNSLLETTKKHLSNSTKRKRKKLSKETIALIERRREINHNTVKDHKAIAEISKQIYKAIRIDNRNFNTKTIIDTIEKYRGPKVFKRKINTNSKQILKLKDNNGKIETDRNKLLKLVEEFYKNLYATTSARPNSSGDDARAPAIEHLSLEVLPQILRCEVEKALKQMKSEKSPGEDGITTKLLRAGGKPVLVKLFNYVMYNANSPTTWKNAVVTMIHKKGDISKLGNYRPISLLSQTYKLFAKILSNRLTKQLDEYQPVEQAGFRSGFSTIDHIHTVKQLMEKSHEYNRSICMAFVDYEKAFDSVEHWAVFNSLHRCNIDARYVDVLKELYSSATMQVKLHDLTDPIPIKRGVRQGDTISPKLFTAVLEDIIKTLEWQKYGININGVPLSHLRFADDLVLFAEKIEDLQSMLEDLNHASLRVGLKMNMAKTKVMSNISGTSTPNVTIGGERLEVVDNYIYLGHILSFGKQHQNREISRRVQLAWAAFGKLEDVLKSRQIPQCLKTRLFNQCVLPTMTYGAETWTLTKEAVHRIRVAQRAMERAMLGIKIQDRIPNVVIRQRTKVHDVGKRITELKWSWAGHLARRGDDRWSKALTEWWPRTSKRSVGRPAARWVDDIIKIAGRTWTRLAQDRGGWHCLREAYTQQWDTEGCG